ncbi:MAG: hypothetical protein HY078_08755 [Elusimicrobia bacterium]|nr:hypothetical protein [Elusimicrobiota bacterium]
MMTVAIVGILASVGPPLLFKLNDFFMMTTARADIENDARNALDTVNRFIRQAKDSTLVISTPSGSGGGIYSKIQFETIDSKIITFWQSGSNLLMSICSTDQTLGYPTCTGGTTQSTLTRNLVFIAFSFPRTDNPTIVSVSLTMGKNIQLSRKKVLELSIQKIRVMN